MNTKLKKESPKPQTTCQSGCENSPTSTCGEKAYGSILRMDTLEELPLCIKHLAQYRAAARIYTGMN
jgi:hypothetical protein